MTYRATTDVVRRVMPLIDRLATRSIDKAHLLQYLSANAGLDWGLYDLVSDRETMVDSGNGLRPLRELVVRDRATGDEHRLRYPEALRQLPTELEPLMLAEYKRLAVNRPLTTMAPPLFDWFFAEEMCKRCRWAGEEHEQVHRECRFAGYPINFEPSTDESPPDPDEIPDLPML